MKGKIGKLLINLILLTLLRGLSNVRMSTAETFAARQNSWIFPSQINRHSSINSRYRIRDHSRNRFVRKNRGLLPKLEEAYTNHWWLDTFSKLLHNHSIPYTHTIGKFHSAMDANSSSIILPESYQGLEEDQLHKKLTDEWYEKLRIYGKWMSKNQWHQFLLKNFETETDQKVRVNIPLLEAVVIGVKRAISECKHQMQYERWNCSIIEEPTSGSLFGNILLRGIPETAFVYSLINAGVLQSVAEACHQRISDCPCDNRGRRTGQNDWHWYGCDHNIFYARKITRKLFDSMERGKHPKFSMNLHNNAAGRRNVAQNMELYCRCHGTSGSCVMKTCYRRIPPMRSIGNILKVRYKNAVRINEINSDGQRFRRKSELFHKPYELYGNNIHARKNQLVYYEDDSERRFCEPDKYYNIHGTHGRECNSTRGSVNSCSNLCCDRGYKSKAIYTMENCNCRFVWCCKVQCEKCLVLKMLESCH